MQSHPPLDPSSHPFEQLHQFSSEDMDCTVEEVRDALKRLNITKASGLISHSVCGSEW